MPNVFAAFTTDVYRTLVTQIAPGFVAIATWLVVLYTRDPSCRFFADHHVPETYVCVILLVIFFGQVCENLGSWIEVREYNRQFPKKHDGGKKNPTREQRDEEWEAYLRTAFVAEPVGQNYTKAIVMRLKFECNSVPALVSGAVGLLVIPSLSCSLKLFIAAIMLLLAWYLRWEIRKTVELLANVRRNLLKQIWIVGEN